MNICAAMHQNLIHPLTLFNYNVNDVMYYNYICLRMKTEILHDSSINIQENKN